MVVAHEIFGHGARFRELGEGELSYGFDAPIPYGSGDAFTRFNGAFPISPLADLTASASGMEAQHSLADAIAERAVARGRLHYREGWLYFRIAHDHGQLHPERVAAFVRGARRRRLSRNVPEGVHRAVLAADAQPGSTSLADHTCGSAPVLLDVRTRCFVHREREPHGSDAAGSDWRWSARDAIGRVRAGALRRRVDRSHGDTARA